MTKKQFIAREIEKNRNRFGRWGSTKKRDSADEMKLSFDSPPRNKEEASQHGNALANTGYYPVGTNECFNVGISGGCGISCYIYLDEGCSDLEELIEKEG